MNRELGEAPNPTGVARQLKSDRFVPGYPARFVEKAEVVRKGSRDQGLQLFVCDWKRKLALGQEGSVRAWDDPPDAEGS
jgi:hypothetical protein